VPTPAPTPFISICPVCQSKIDVTDFEPFSKVACPSCGQLVRVRRNFDHFRIVKQIGEGGMSRVFEAEDETLGRRIALKILNQTFSRDATRVAQFKREALVTARINHLNVIKLYTTGEDHDYFYIAMELVGGGSLEQRIKTLGRLDEAEALRIGREVAEGLRAAQKDGLIHRDVKPANILFTDTGTAKVVDFGLALFVETQTDDSGEIWATPYYVAPEKVEHQTEDYRSDIFSLGATLYHALTGKPPHKANTNSIDELRHIKASPVSLEDSGLRFSPRTISVINRMLAIDPAKRTADYDTVVEELRVAERLVGRSGLTSVQPKWIAAAATIALLFFAYLFWNKDSGSRRAAATIAKTTLTDVNTLTGNGVTVTAGVATLSERFRQARDTLVQGNMADAKTLFDQLLTSNEMKQPTLNWARYHAAVCAALQADQDTFNSYHQAILTDQPLDEDNPLLNFFSTLSKRIINTVPNDRLRPSDLNYPRETEQLLGYLMHGLQQWHFGNLKKGATLLNFTFDSLPAFTASNTNTSYDWIPDYTKSLQTRLSPQLELWDWLSTLPDPIAEQDIQAVLGRLRENLNTLPKDTPLSIEVRSKLRDLNRQLAQQQILANRSQLLAQRELQKAESTQLEELLQLLPSLRQGYDFSNILAILTETQFQSLEVQSTLEGRRYLYQNAQKFIETLSKDIATQAWRGKIHRSDGSIIESAQITALSPTSTTLSFERGTSSLPTESISPETLIDIATAFTNLVTDSADYYQRLEQTACFARITDLPSISSALAASLMEENRAFRTRWLKAL
jgi:tRNA A-37 threonylcarbamoyl transferase component Bud32